MVDVAKQVSVLHACVGSVLAKPLAQKYGTLSAFRAAAAAKDSAGFVAELCELEGVGDTTAEGIDRFLRDAHVQTVLDKLIKLKSSKARQP